MVKTIVEGGGDFTPTVATESVSPIEWATPGVGSGHAVATPMMANLATVGFLGSRQDVENELDSIASRIRLFHLLPPDAVLREAGAYTARLTELAVLLHRREATDRQYTRLRTMQVQRYLDELERQIKLASRLVEVSRQDIEISR